MTLENRNRQGIRWEQEDVLQLKMNNDWVSLGKKEEKDY